MTKHNPAYSLPTAVSVVALAVAAPVSAQDATSVEFRTGATLASDPFLVTGESGSKDAVALNFEVLPEVRWQDETSVVRLGGQVRYEEWLNRYGSDISGTASLSAQKQASETLQLHGGVSYQTRDRPRPDALVSYLPDEDLGDPLVFEAPIDPTLDQQFSRRQSVSANFGFDKSLSPTQSWFTEVTGVSNWFEVDGLDYRTAGLSTGYTQQLNPRLAMNIGLSGTLSDYEVGSRGDGVIGNATVGFDLQLSETGSLRTGAGIGYSRVDSGENTKETNTFFVANASLCEQTGRSRLCAAGSRETRPTAFGGATKVTSASLGWDLTLGEAESLSVNAGYTDSKASTAFVDEAVPLRSKYASAAVRYSRSLSKNLGFYFAPSATKIFDDPTGRGSNYQVSVGLSYIFGR